MRCVLDVVSGGTLTIAVGGYIAGLGSTVNVNGGSLVVDGTIESPAFTLSNGGSINIAFGGYLQVYGSPGTFSAVSGTTLIIAGLFQANTGSTVTISPGCNCTQQAGSQILVGTNATFLAAYTGFSLATTATKLDDVTIPAVQSSSLTIPITPRTYAGASALPSSILVVPYRNGVLDSLAMGGCHLPSPWAGILQLLANYSGDTGLTPGDQLDLYVELTINSAVSARWYHAQYDGVSAILTAVMNLAGQDITVVSSVVTGGDIPITQYDDYLLEEGTQIAFTNASANWAGGNIASCYLTISSGGIPPDSAHCRRGSFGDGPYPERLFPDHARANPALDPAGPVLHLPAFDPGCDWSPDDAGGGRRGSFPVE